MRHIGLLAGSLLLSLITAVSGAWAQSAPVKEWTILVYLNADNNLYRDGLNNIAQMERVGSSDNVNVIVQLDPEPGNLQTTRYYITRNPNPAPGNIKSQVLSQEPETNMGSWNTLANFLTWGVQAYPAKKYMVVVWNHGNGWQGISYDDHPNAYIRIPELRQALEQANKTLAAQAGQLRLARGPIDVVNFDACLMSTLEVAYELRNNGKYLVGSQFLEPGAGEDYSSFLAPLVQKPGMTPREFSEIMVYQYVKQYQNEREINYASVDLTRIDAFTKYFNEMTKAMGASPLSTKIKTALTNDAYTGFDIVSAFTKVQGIVSADPKLTQAVSGLLQLYGYPAEAAITAQSRSEGIKSSAQPLKVMRYAPGVVAYRQGAGAWQKLSLNPMPDRTYQAQLPAGVQQYYVTPVSLTDGSGSRLHEALTTKSRGRSGEIAYHNNFPETSPLVADAYSSLSKGAHGMTLYSLAGAEARLAPQSAGLGQTILAEYKKLSFATQGAPAWTAFFGF